MRSWRGRIEIRRVALPSFQIKGGLVELEYFYSANPPLAVDRLYGDRHRQLRRHGIGEPPALVVYSPLLPLFLLLFTGLYMFVLPYAAKLRGVRGAG